MPTNEQRRATAKRKLERQLERRAAQAAQAPAATRSSAPSWASLVVVAAVVATVMFTNARLRQQTASAATTTPTARRTQLTAPVANGQLPAFTAPADLGANCQYPAAGSRPASRTTPPRTGKVPTDPAQISASMSTNQGNIGLQLDNAKAPCTVNSFASLAQQGFFNDTPCHRLTTSEGLAVLQCGDPTGQGSGGPGYQFANEYPTNQFQPDDPSCRSR